MTDEGRGLSLMWKIFMKNWVGKCNLLISPLQIIHIAKNLLELWWPPYPRPCSLRQDQESVIERNVIASHLEMTVLHSTHKKKISIFFDAIDEMSVRLPGKQASEGRRKSGIFHHLVIYSRHHHVAQKSHYHYLRPLWPLHYENEHSEGGLCTWQMKSHWFGHVGQNKS